MVVGLTHGADLANAWVGLGWVLELTRVVVAGGGGAIRIVWNGNKLNYFSCLHNLIISATRPMLFIIHTVYIFFPV